MKPRPALFVVLSLLAVTPSQSQEPAAHNADVTSAPPTKMETYNVDEALSPKTHTLFMGADIDLSLDRDLYRVHDVEGSNWVVRISGRDHVISAKSAPEHLKITPTLKLTEASVTITGFTKARAYSFANDPSVLLTQGLSRSSAMGTDLQAAGRDAQARADVSGNHALGASAWFAGADDQFSANAIMTSAQYAYYARSQTTVSVPASTSTAGNQILPDVTGNMLSQQAALFVMNNPTADLNRGISSDFARTAQAQTENGNEATGKIVTGGLDSLDVQFAIRSAKMLRNPYVVTMTRFRTPGSKPGFVQNMIYAKSINPVDDHISRIHLVEEGFPFGFEIVDFQLHVYNQGLELATNIAANRVELTRDEAFEYVKMEYLGAHQKDTLSPSVAMGRLPQDLPAKLASGKYATTYYVKVSTGGFADEAYSDAACRDAVGDIYLNAVIKNLRFKPALHEGKAVDGVASVNLGRLEIL